MKLFRTLTILLVLSVWASAGESDAFKKVAGARFFAFGGIGVAGITSDEEISFRELLAAKTAEADFLRLLKTGNAPAKCYALVGLRLKNRAGFETQAEAFLNARTEIETVAGCNIMKQPMSSVVTAIRAGNYDQQAQRDLKR